MATLSRLKKFAEQFELTGLEIVEVDPDRIRITTPHIEEERLKRRQFWLWLFGELCGSLYVVGDPSCVFVVRQPEELLPPTFGDRIKRIFHLAVPIRHAPPVSEIVAMEKISLGRRHRAIIREQGRVSFIVPEDAVPDLERIGVDVDPEKSLGGHEVVISPLQMQSLTLPIAQVLFLFLL